MEVRRTGAADLPSLYDIFSEAIAGVYEPHAFEPPRPPFEVFAAQQRHVLEHDGDLCAVAEDEGRIVGFASAWRRGDAWFLASLFVRTDAHGRGVGRALLDAAWGGSVAHRRTITDAIQPVSNALYARRGLIPATPILAFAGRPASVGADELEPLPIDRDALRRVDRAAYGFDRAVDHEHWSAVGRTTLWARRGETVAYSYVFPDGTIGPVAGTDDAAAAAALAGELARSAEPVRVRIPGSARELVATAVAAGLRLSPTPGLLLLGPETPAPTALAIASYTLY